jgi:hypothetical protein
LSAKLEKSNAHLADSHHPAESFGLRVAVRMSQEATHKTGRLVRLDRKTDGAVPRVTRIRVKKKPRSRVKKIGLRRLSCIGMICSSLIPARPTRPT